MQELRAQIHAQLKLADTLKKLGDHAGIDRKSLTSKVKAFSVTAVFYSHKDTVSLVVIPIIV